MGRFQMISSMERHLDQYANATTGDRESLANLVTSNATLVATNSELTAKMETCLVEITKLQKEVKKLQKSSRNRGTRGGGGSGGSGGGRSWG